MVIQTVIGLILIGIGTYFLARNSIISKEKAIELGVMRVAGDTPEENLKLPAVQDKLKQSRDSKIGLVIVSIGTILILIDLFA